MSLLDRSRRSSSSRTSFRLDTPSTISPFLRPEMNVTLYVASAFTREILTDPSSYMHFAPIFHLDPEAEKRLRDEGRAFPALPALLGGKKLSYILCTSFAVRSSSILSPLLRIHREISVAFAGGLPLGAIFLIRLATFFPFTTFLSRSNFWYASLMALALLARVGVDRDWRTVSFFASFADSFIPAA